MGGQGAPELIPLSGGRSAECRHHGHLGRAPKWRVVADEVLPAAQSRMLTLLRSLDVNHDMSKTRISKDGTPIEAPKGKELKGDLERISSQKAEGYCKSLARCVPKWEADPSPRGCIGGTCYGGTPPSDGPNPGCCNSCEEVREAYVRRGWSFVNPDSVEQVCRGRSPAPLSCAFGSLSPF